MLNEKNIIEIGQGRTQRKEKKATKNIMKNLNKNEKKSDRKKKIINIFEIMLIGMFLINCISALEINSGESINLTLPEEFDYYSIIGNLTEVNLNISQNGNVVIIQTNKYAKSDSFQIIFFNKEKEVIVEHHYSSGGGGGSRTTYITNETIVEVDNYIDREVIVEKEIEIEIIKEVEVVKHFSLLDWVLLFLLVPMFYFIISRTLKLYSNKKEKEIEENI